MTDRCTACGRGQRADEGGTSFDQSSSIEELAATYIEEIRTFRKHGPYSLGGASFGGVVAFEMARQLRAMGEPLESPVLLFDSFIAEPKGWVAPGQTMGFLGAALAALDEPLDPKPDDEPPRRSYRRLLRATIKHPRATWRVAQVLYRSLVWRISSWRVVRRSRWTIKRLMARTDSFETAHLVMAEQYLEVALDLVQRYERQPIEEPGVLFRSVMGPNPEPDWRPLFGAGLQVHVRPGAHLELLEEPGVIETVELLRPHLG